MLCFGTSISFKRRNLPPIYWLADQKYAALFQRRYNSEKDTYYRNLVMRTFYISAFITQTRYLQDSSCC